MTLATVTPTTEDRSGSAVQPPGPLGQSVVYPTHWLPSTQGFVDASLKGMGWCLNPAQLVMDHLASGRLVELVPDAPLDVPLFWQVNRLAADRLSALTRSVVATAKRELLSPT